jgi:fructoselysine 6-kinase
VPEVVAFGDNVVDCYADHGVMFPGGNALNVAVFVRRFGGRSAYLGAVADDPAGRQIRDALNSEGVDISGLRIVPGRTAFCVIGNREGEREFLRADLGVSIIEPTAADLDRIAGASAVHTGRSSHVDRYLPAFAERACLSFDFAVVRDTARIERIAPLCFLASFSGGGLSEEDVAALQRVALGAGARWCLVTRGGEGATLAGPSGVHRTAAIPAKLVDTLGAGDTFIARCLVGLLRDEGPDDLLRAAAVAASETCGHLGGFGHPAPMQIDETNARSLEECYGDASDVRA